MAVAWKSLHKEVVVEERAALPRRLHFEVDPITEDGLPPLHAHLSVLSGVIPLLLSPTSAN